ncbi:MAG: spermidine/putrescine ABC transporter substrate-binding protein [Bryobacteraceae bacterium]|jgi:Spermidine/putrescine-binding periplasmic protein|nr:spermidine/putrescine ABC transporter substrate-binding protein [Bryobacteraceae bacterium]
MNRRTFFLGLSGLAGCSRHSRPRLNIFNWSNYVAERTIPDFEREFGVSVRYAVYESNEEMMARVLSGNSGWDIVFPSNYYIQPMAKLGLLAPLRHALLPNLSHLDPAFQRPSWDPELRWCVPYMWGSSGILYHTRLQPPPESWSDLWDERLRGRLTMLDDPAEVLGACLKKLGYSLNSHSEHELRRAQAEALKQKHLLRAYLNAEVREQMVAGDLSASQLWATTSQQAIDESPELRYVYPSEGFALYADNAAILRESRRQELAHQFLNYLLRPEVAATVVAETRTATANAKARLLLPEADRSNETLYPSQETLARGEWFEPMPPSIQRLRDRLWTEIKSA